MGSARLSRAMAQVSQTDRVVSRIRTGSSGQVGFARVRAVRVTPRFDHVVTVSGVCGRLP